MNSFKSQMCLLEIKERRLGERETDWLTDCEGHGSQNRALPQRLNIEQGSAKKIGERKRAGGKRNQYSVLIKAQSFNIQHSVYKGNNYKTHPQNSIATAHLSIQQVSISLQPVNSSTAKLAAAAKAGVAVLSDETYSSRSAPPAFLGSCSRSAQPVQVEEVILIEERNRLKICSSATQKRQGHVRGRPGLEMPWNQLHSYADLHGIGGSHYGELCFLMI